MKRNLLVWTLGAVTARALDSVAPKPYAMNSTALAVIPPPHASGARLSISSPLSSRPCDSLTNSSVWPAASVVPYPVVSLSASSLITPTASLVSASVSDVLTTQPMAFMPTLISSADLTSALQPVNSPHIVEKAAATSTLPASSSIDLELLSSILLSGLPDTYTKTETETTTVIVSLTLPNPLPTSSSDSVSSSLVTLTTSVTAKPSLSSETSLTEFPTSPPFSYNPSASRGSATPILRPTPESSSANAVGSTLSTSSTPSTTGNMEIPPAPSAAGGSSSLGGRGKERVWWVAFLVPFLLGA